MSCKNNQDLIERIEKLESKLDELENKFDHNESINNQHELVMLDLGENYYGSSVTDLMNTIRDEISGFANNFRSNDFSMYVENGKLILRLV